MSKKIINFFTGFCFGAATGVGVALLNAPKSGKETRAQIRNEIDETRARAEIAVADAQAGAMGQISEIQGRVNDFVDKVSGKVVRAEETDMPYKSNSELPKGVKNVLPKHAQDIYREAFNSAWDQYDRPEERRGDSSREETAHRVAWSAVKSKYEKSEGTGKWKRKKRASPSEIQV